MANRRYEQKLIEVPDILDSHFKSWNSPGSVDTLLCAHSPFEGGIRVQPSL
jgi:hypothetical protein